LNQRRRKYVKMKKMFTRVLIGALLGALTELQSQSPTEAMRLAVRMNQLPSNLELGSISSREGFVAALRMVKKPGGVVTVRSDCDNETRRFFALPAGFALDDALDALVTIENTSYWAVRNSVVNLIPKKGPPPVMHVRISEFEWDTSDYVLLTIGRLFRSVTVRTQLEQLNLTSGLSSIMLLQRAPRIINGIKVSDPPGERHSLNDLPLLDALNTIVASYGDKIWMYEERTCGAKSYFNISAQ
jgi:uncharacterized membrane protein